MVFSSNPKGALGIVGHVGVGHVHSHSGFVQDDSAGLAVASSILKLALPVDTTIASIEASIHQNSITIRTMGGGEASASPRRGISLYEKDLMESRGLGLDASYSQNAAVTVFGRLYGQGICETAATFQGVCALAVLDTFLKAAPEQFHVSKPAPAGYLDKAITTVLNLEGLDIALMLLVNFTQGGIGPAEDFEGNVPFDFKGAVMEAVGLDAVPTVVLESKAFIPALAGELSENKLMVRAQEGVDNLPLGEALYGAAQEQNIPITLKTNSMPLTAGGLAKMTADFGDKIIALAEQLKAADDCMEKVTLVSQLATLISQDAGGVTFMGNSVNDQMRGAGIMAGSGVVLSMIVTKDYADYVKIPMLTPADVQWYMDTVASGLKQYNRGV